MNALLATHGRPSLLAGTLRSLLAPENRGLLTRVVVVGNGGECGAREVVSGFESDGRITFRAITMANKSAALNEGLKFCDDGLIFLTDDDVQVPSDTIRLYSDAAKAFGPGNYFAGETKPIYTLPPKDWLMPFLPASATGWPTKPLEDAGRWNCIGFNWAAYRQDLMAAGGFNPQFGPGSSSGATGQESEMQRRLWEKCGAVGRFVHGALVEHMVPVERCNPEWAIGRAFRHGIEKGILAGQNDFTEALSRVERRIGKGRWRRCVAWLSCDEVRRFRAAYWDAFDSGFKKGALIAAERTAEAGPLDA